MKNPLPRVLALLTLGTVITLAPVALAQNKPADPAGAKPKAQAGPRADQLQKMAEELDLTPQQKEQIKPILKEQAAKAKALRADTSLSQQDRRAKNKELRDDLTAKMKKILKPDQYEKWEKARAARAKAPAKTGAKAETKAEK